MRVFRKRKKFGNFGGSSEDAEPLPDIVYQMGAESAARYAMMHSTPYGVIDVNAQQGAYGYPMAGETDEVRSSSPLGFVASMFGIRRSRSKERRAAKSKERFFEGGSPARFGDQPPGTPIKYRRRPASPELVRSRPSSPYNFISQERMASPIHFAPPERSASPMHLPPRSHPNSPDVIRRLHRAQVSQDIQRMEREQRLQQEMMLMNPNPFMPQYPQPPDAYYSLMNSNPYLQAYPSLPQQPPMYSYF